MKRKNVIVTGGSRGIGYSIAEALLKEGFLVHITGRDRATLNSAKKSLANYGTVITHTLDQSDKKKVTRFTKSFKGSLYALVNNAGICETLPLRSSEADPWERVLATNLSGPYYLTKGLLPKIKPGGRIVNISSQLGLVGREDYSAYSASKFGLNGLTSVWAKELGQKGILVNAVLPGWVSTEMTVKDVERLAKAERKSYAKKYKELSEPLELKRFTKPEEVASLVTFLLSESASGVTGRSWLLNGPAA